MVKQLNVSLQKYRLEVGTKAMDHLLQILRTDRCVSNNSKALITFYVGVWGHLTHTVIFLVTVRTLKSWVMLWTHCTILFAMTKRRNQVCYCFLIWSGPNMVLRFGIKQQSFPISFILNVSLNNCQ